MRTRLGRFNFLVGYYLALIALLTAIGIQVPFHWSVVEVGTIEPSKRAVIKAEDEGIISDVYVKDGEFVKKGELIAKMDDPRIDVEVAADRAEYEKALMQVEYARRMHDKGYVSNAELRTAEIGYRLEQTKLHGVRSFEIVAPIDGVLLTTDELSLRVGDKVEPGSVIATVADLDEMRMKIRVHEHNIGRIQLGDEVRVYLNAFPSMLYNTIVGHVSTIIPQAQSDLTGTYFVVIVNLEKNNVVHGNRKFRLSPGMAGTAKIIYDHASFFRHAIMRSFDTL